MSAWWSMRREPVALAGSRSVSSMITVCVTRAAPSQVGGSPRQPDDDADSGRWLIGPRESVGEHDHDGGAGTELRCTVDPGPHAVPPPPASWTCVARLTLRTVCTAVSTARTRTCIWRRPARVRTASISTRARASSRWCIDPDVSQTIATSGIGRRSISNATVRLRCARRDGRW